MEDRKKTILENEKLIYAVIKKMKIYSEQEDYYDIGMIGLIKAVDSYDDKKNIAFSTYAFRCIHNEISMEFRKMNGNKRKANYNTISLDEIVYKNNDGDSIKLIDILPDSSNLEEDMIKKNYIAKMNDVMYKLTTKERIIINLSYGLNGHKQMKQDEIAEYFNVSRTDIAHLKNKAINKLRKYINK